MNLYLPSISQRIEFILYICIINEFFLCFGVYPPLSCRRCIFKDQQLYVVFMDYSDGVGKGL